MKRDFLALKDFTPDEIKETITKAVELKKHPEKYAETLKQKTLLMIFEKPSLRTRLSFETGMTQLGGHAIYYDMATSPLGKKETMHDTAKTASRYCDIIMARLFRHSDIEELAKNSAVPVINALTDFSHPCQILCDLMTIQEKKGKLRGLTVAYLGDSNNNVTHSLIEGCSMVGMNIKVGCPADMRYAPQEKVLNEAKKVAEKSGAKIAVTGNAGEAVKDADIVYTDSWMSYHIPESEKWERVKTFKPYQVTAALMKLAKPDALFMHCLPAQRGYEVTEEVIDGKQSVVFDQAENRLHGQKAIMLKLMNRF